MFLRSKGLVCPTYINISKRLISNEIKEVLNTRLEPPSGMNGNQIQLAVVSKNLNALNLDVFVNNLPQYEDRRSAVLDLLASLRATKMANTSLESTHFGVVRHLMENSSIQEVVPVLLDRPQYGIFLNNFTAFAVTQSLHEEQEYDLGLPLALKLVLLDEIDSKFVQGFCLKSVMESLKKELLKGEAKEEKEAAPPAPKGKVQEKKVRVKFLRNELQIDQHFEMGKAVLKISPKILEGSSKDNAFVLGLVLTAKYEELNKFLGSKTIEINADLVEICKELLTKSDQADLLNKIEKLQTKNSFSEQLDGFLKEAATKEAVTLAEKQKQLLPQWQQIRNQRKVELENEESQKERIQNIEQLQGDIATQKELLWFFDNEEKLDLDIYNKRVFYPKKWFGKKKKPRVVDEHYVPPQIRRIN